MYIQHLMCASHDQDPHFPFFWQAALLLVIYLMHNVGGARYGSKINVACASAFASFSIFHSDNDSSLSGNATQFIDSRQMHNIQWRWD
mmetsp:Transcript_2674/g.7009  ORF Transcript_2674/g.7009 Transcript_2674/m.7009 type:complete len:88 (-) Transcript_2674:766-1029(-)